MMRPLTIDDIPFEEQQPPKFGLIKPKYRKDKAWRSYKRWWLSKQYYAMWIGCDPSFPFKRTEYIVTQEGTETDPWVLTRA